MADNVIRSLVTRLGFSVNKRGADQYEKRAERVKAGIEQIGASVDKITRGIATSIAGAAASLGAFTAFVAAQDEAARTVQKFSTATGVNADRLQQLGFVARETGVEMEDFGQAFVDIGEKARDAVKNDASMEFFTALDVALVDVNGSMRSTEAITLDTFEALRKQEGSNEAILNGVGLLSDNYARLAPLISKGREEIERQAASQAALNSVISKDALKATRDLSREAQRLGDNARVLANRFLVAVAPAILKGSKALRAFLNDTERVNKTIGIIKSVGAAFAAAFASSVAAQFLRIMTLAPVVLLNAARAALTAGGAFGVLKAALGFLPVVLGVGVVALRDIHSMMSGGESVIGDFITRFEESEGVLGSVARALRTAAPFLAGLFTQLQGIAEQALPLLSRGLSMFVALVGEVVPKILPIVSQVVGTVGRLLSDAAAKLLPLVGSLLQTIMTQVVPLVGFIGQIVQSVLALVVPLFPAFVAIIAAGLQIIRAVLPVVTGIAGSIAATIESLLPILLPIFAAIAQGIAFVAQVFGGTFDFIAGLLGPAVRTIGRWIDRINGWLDPLLSKFQTAVRFASKIPGLGFLSDSLGGGSSRQASTSAIERDFARQALTQQQSTFDRRQITANNQIKINVDTRGVEAPATAITRAVQDGLGQSGTSLASQLGRAA